MVNGVSNVSFQGGAQPAEYRVIVPFTSKRKEDLPADIVQISTKKEPEEDKTIVQKTCDTIGKGVKSFVEITVNAFAKSASDAVVGKTIEKITGK